MTGIRLSLALLLTLLLQLTLADRLGIMGIRPDLTILFLVFLGARRGPVMGTLLGFVVGLMQDLLVPELLGMNMLAKSILGYGVGRVTGSLMLDNMGIRLGLVGVSVLLHDFIYLLAYTGLDIPRLFIMFISQSIPTAIYTALVGLVIIMVASAVGGARSLSTGEEGSFGRG